MILAPLYLGQRAKKKEKKWDMGNPKSRKEQMAKTGLDFYISPGCKKKPIIVPSHYHHKFNLKYWVALFEFFFFFFHPK